MKISEDFSTAILLKSAEVVGEIEWFKGMPFLADDLWLLKSQNFMDEYPDLLKGRALPEGHISTYSDGSRWKKQGKKWIQLKDKKQAAKEEDKEDKKAGWKAYARVVAKMDKDATFVRMPGISSGVGILVNEDKNVAYLPSATERGHVKEVKLDELRRAVQLRKKSAPNTEYLAKFYDRIDSDEIDQAIEAGANVHTVAITDPDVTYYAKETRSFRVVDMDGEPIIVDGPFKGYSLDDMITTKQRLRGSAGFMMDENGQVKRRHYLSDTKKRMVNVFHEPYVKLAGAWARIYVPWGDVYTKKKLMEVSGMEHLSKGGHVFRIPVHRILEVTKQMGSMAMDQNMETALKTQLEKRNNALLAPYIDPKALADREKSAQEILKKDYEGYWNGGHDIPGLIKAFPNGTPLQLRFTQAQAVKRMVNNPKGAILGLDTGLGKTIASIAYHMKMRQLGKYHKGSNGKMLIVSMNSNVNTWKNEINDVTVGGGEFKTRADGAIENEHFVIMPGTTFGKKYGPNGEGNPEDLKKFGSIVADEPQEYMKNKDTMAYQAMANLDHPRKIISSESVMTKDPSELINYVMIQDNIHDPVQRKDMIKQFNKNFETVGKARFMRPEQEENVRQYIKENVIYFHKTDEPFITFKGEDGVQRSIPRNRGDENASREGRSVDLSPAVLKVYREKSAKIAATLTNAIKNLEKTKSELKNPDADLASKAFTDLREFVAMPENFIPELKGRNPKVERAVIDAKNHFDNGRTSLTFAKGPELTLKAAKRYSQVLSGGISVAFTSPSKATERKTPSIDPDSKALLEHASKVTFWKDGKVVASYDVEKDMRKNFLTMPQMIEKFQAENPKYASNKIASIHAPDSYNAGHNLQKSAHVVQHLDRDNWNPKVMYQRESRVIRPDKTGQVTHGTVHTYDIADNIGGLPSIDQYERLKSQHEQELFNRIVFGSTTTKLEAPDTEIKTPKEIRSEANRRRMMVADLGAGPQVDLDQTLDAAHSAGIPTPQQVKAKTKRKKKVA